MPATRGCIWQYAQTKIVILPNYLNNRNKQWSKIYMQQLSYLGDSLLLH